MFHCTIYLLQGKKKYKITIGYANAYVCIITVKKTKIKILDPPPTLRIYV